MYHLQLSQEEEYQYDPGCDLMTSEEATEADGVFSRHRYHSNHCALQKVKQSHVGHVWQKHTGSRGVSEHLRWFLSFCWEEIFPIWKQANVLRNRKGCLNECTLIWTIVQCYMLHLGSRGAGTVWRAIWRLWHDWLLTRPPVATCAIDVDVVVYMFSLSGAPASSRRQ